MFTSETRLAEGKFQLVPVAELSPPPGWRLKTSIGGGSFVVSSSYVTILVVNILLRIEIIYKGCGSNYNTVRNQ